jgi:hypothetical protein
MNNKWYNSDFAGACGMGILLFLLCLGIGTCCMLGQSSINIDQPQVEKIENEL